MKRYIVCSLDDENYTQAGYEFCNTFEEAKQMCVNLVMGAKNFKTQEDAKKNMTFSIVKDTSSKSWRYDYNDERRFNVHYIIEIEVHENDYLCIWHHAYNGVDFYVEKIGTREECLKKMESSKISVLNDFEDAEVDFETCIDVGEEWYVWDIIQFSESIEEDKVLNAEVTFRLEVREDESDEMARERFFRLLYDNLCTLVDHHIDFEISSQEVG